MDRNDDSIADGAAQNSLAAVLSSSFRSRSPIAEEAIARDVAQCHRHHGEEAIDSESEAPVDMLGPTMYRRPSGVAYGPARPVFDDLSVDAPVLTPREMVQSRDAERVLLQDNHILPPTESETKPVSSWWGRWVAKPRKRKEGREPQETTPLLPGHHHEASYGDEELNQQWNEAVSAGRIRTTWAREARTIGSYAAPLLVAFMLQYSINVVCIFAVGRIGKVELGAVSRTYTKTYTTFFRQSPVASILLT